mmetsp:Transcript_1246/g.5106  ORF Transcript_1246/g.5106 Transcript_1246/m.5106 type:complete len:275 (+) Transcript_1246:355-1179(+)
MSHEPHVHVVVLREPLDPRQHLAHVLRLRLPLRPLVVQLVVGVDEEAADAVPHDRRARQADDPVHGGELVVLVADQHELVVEPVQPRAHRLRPHPCLFTPVLALEPRLAGVLLDELARVLVHLVLQRAQRERPPVLHREVAHERVDPLGLAAVGHAGDDGELAGDGSVVPVDAAPARAHALHLARLAHAEVVGDVVLEVAEPEQPAQGEPLGVIDAPAHRGVALLLQHVVGVLAPLRPRHPVAPLLAKPSGELLGERLPRPVAVHRDDDAAHRV